jgi:DNA invertase Pin-like site-specific DNA recombinase
MSTAYNVGIYCRLSREDLKNGKNNFSVSIENQQAIIEKYVAEKGWDVYKVYVDDDFSGTNFDRPAFQEMINDAKNGKLNCVITKDLSRFGRDYIQSGLYRELLTRHGVRYVTASGEHDSNNDNGYDSLTPFIEMMNERYAAEIGLKVRATKKLMAEQGKFSNGRAPYGYVKSPENKHKLVIDENVSHIVVRVFELFNGGLTGRAIADLFNREGIPTINDYYFSQINKKPNPYKSTKAAWCSGSVTNILNNPVYYGAMANGKRKVNSFKDKRITRQNKSDWIVIEDTHEPIIAREVWDIAQAISSKNHKDTVRRSANGEVSIFSSVLKCADCGGNMNLSRKPYVSCTREFFRCSTYVQKGKNACTMHSVDYDVVYQDVLQDIQKYAVIAEEDEKKLIDKILNDNNEFKNKNVNRYAKSISESKNRVKQIDGLLTSLFEEKQNGDVSDTIYKRMMKKYEDEQTKLLTDISQMENELEKCQRVQHDLSAWIERIKNCISIDSLTRQIVVELIDRIEVSEIYYVNGEATYDLKISYRFGIPASKNASSNMTNKIAC